MPVPSENQAVLSRDEASMPQQDELLITDVECARSALRASEERYRALVDGHAEMVCRFRPDGTILFANNAYARARETTAQALLEANFWDFVPEEDRPAVRAMLDSLTPESRESRVENRFVTAAGERWIHWTNRALSFAPNGRLLEAQSTGIDITDRKRMEQALKESDRRKDEFLATLAHELRNPLAPISNSLQILKRSGDDREQRQQAHAAIDRQLGYLVRLVDDLLDVSRITRDKLELRPSRIELGPVVRQAVETCRPMADQQDQSLAVALPDDPVFLDADPVRLAQVLNNLLNNACKYSPAGGRIDVAVLREEGQVAISVKDNGLGMPPDKLETVFEMFAQVHGSADPGGLGIGLTLVKRLVELHNGSIEARSEGRGKGSEFIVRLPEAASRPLGSELERSETPAAPESRRVLVVDDNHDSADSLGMLLQLQGHATHVAYDGVAAVEEAERFKPEIVLLDLGLPRLNGIEACRRIRSEAWGRQMTIVALTGWGQEKDRRESRDAGFDEHIVKPVEPDVLARLLAQT
jgi:PAS domain S-box-containing protein